VFNAGLQDRFLEMKAALQEKGIVITPRRQKLLEVLLASDHHPTVSEIHEGVKEFYPGTSLATIYNTMELLKEMGQVLEIEFSSAANRYDGRRPDSHAHLICLRCEKVEDLDAIELNDHLEDISRATGYQIVRRRTDYYGVCPDCQTSSPPLSSEEDEDKEVTPSP
jgi:Fur family peroxide stress response transcriptional regulator